MNLSSEVLGRIDLAVSNVAASLLPDVAYIRHEIAEDWAQGPAVLFRLVIADGLSLLRRKRLYSQSSGALRESFDFDALGLHTYFAYRSVSEQAALKDLEWAA
jgi:hypothetical protein